MLLPGGGSALGRGQQEGAGTAAEALLRAAPTAAAFARECEALSSCGNSALVRAALTAGGAAAVAVGVALHNGSAEAVLWGADLLGRLDDASLGAAGRLLAPLAVELLALALRQHGARLASVAEVSSLALTRLLGRSGAYAGLAADTGVARAARAAQTAHAASGQVQAATGALLALLPADAGLPAEPEEQLLPLLPLGATVPPSAVAAKLSLPDQLDAAAAAMLPPCAPSHTPSMQWEHHIPGRKLSRRHGAQG